MKEYLFLTREKINSRLDLSRKESERGQERFIYCPECHMKLLKAYSYDHVVISVKCRNCGFNEPIDIAYFRTMKKKKEPCFEEFMARYRETGIR